jgi:hypothetical protein
MNGLVVGVWVQYGSEAWSLTTMLEALKALSQNFLYLQNDSYLQVEVEMPLLLRACRWP